MPWTMPNRRQFLLWGSQSLAAAFLASKVPWPHPDPQDAARLILARKLELARQSFDDELHRRYEFVVTNVDRDAGSVTFQAVPRE